MPTYRQADGFVAEQITRLVASNHPKLAEIGVTFDTLFAYAPRDKKSGEPTGPALKKYGAPTVGVIRVTSQRERVKGAADTEISLDGEQFPEWDEARQLALLDHLLQHLEIQYEDGDSGAQVKMDDCFRPKLKLQPPDWLLSGFEVIAKRHGDASLEVREMRRTVEQFGQVLQVH